jgi:hypothetical protein
MSHIVARAAKPFLMAAVIGVAGVGIALGSASVAYAEPKSFKQSEDSLKMMCDRYGGAFIPSSGSGGPICAWKDGSDTVCDKKENCVIVEKAVVRFDPSLPLPTLGPLEAVDQAGGGAFGSGGGAASGTGMFKGAPH